jgi:hypothetical protein
MAGTALNHRVLDVLEDEIDAHDAEHETEIADAGDDEGLDGRPPRRRPLIPEADQRGADPRPPSRRGCMKLSAVISISMQKGTG